MHPISIDLYSSVKEAVCTWMILWGDRSNAAMDKHQLQDTSQSPQKLPGNNMFENQKNFKLNSDFLQSNV